MKKFPARYGSLKVPVRIFREIVGGPEVAAGWPNKGCGVVIFSKKFKNLRKVQNEGAV